MPIQNITLASGAEVAFAEGLTLTKVPSWLTTEKLVGLSNTDREEFKQCKVALVATYEAASLGDPDPAWLGAEPRSIQASKSDLATLAHLALWLGRPGPLWSPFILHAPQFEGEPFPQQILCGAPLLCHPQDVEARPSHDDLMLAAGLHTALRSVRTDTPIWTAVRSTWSALHLDSRPVRLLLLWIALEALFGPDDAREMSFRLAQRIGLFLESDATRSKGLFATAKRGYGFRSKVAHGRWKEDKEFLVGMAEAEDLIRRSLTRILLDPSLLSTFSSKAREEFLDGLAF